MIKQITGICILMCVLFISSCQDDTDDSREIYRRLMQDTTVVGSDLVWKGTYDEESGQSDYVLVYGMEGKNIKLTVITHDVNGNVKKQYTKELQVVDSGKNWTTLAPVGVKNIEEYKTTSGLKFILKTSKFAELRSLDNRFIVLLERVN